MLAQSQWALFSKEGLVFLFKYLEQTHSWFSLYKVARVESQCGWVEWQPNSIKSLAFSLTFPHFRSQMFASSHSYLSLRTISRPLPPDLWGSHFFKSFSSLSAALKIVWRFLLKEIYPLTICIVVILSPFWIQHCLLVSMVVWMSLDTAVSELSWSMQCKSHRCYEGSTRTHCHRLRWSWRSSWERKAWVAETATIAAIGAAATLRGDGEGTCRKPGTKCSYDRSKHAWWSFHCHRPWVPARTDNRGS